MDSSSFSSTSMVSLDPTSSLRAAALLTLKSKRRKPPTDHSISLRPSLRPPPPSDSVQLDYGSEEVASVESQVPPSTTYSAASTTPTNEEQGREEGEISDEEEQPTTSLVELEVPIAANLMFSSHVTPGRSSRHPESPPPSLMDRLSDPPQFTSSTSSALQDASPKDRHFLIDPDHVRPGLALRQSEYDTAKDIILDLLGWGVPSEYLVDCGLTREIIYYVFNELNLRLPQDFDTTSLVPYTPDLLRTSFRGSSLSASAINDMNSSTDYSGVNASHINPIQDKHKLSGHTHNDQGGSAIQPISTFSDSDLHNMERQRRQELIARKAVQASRKSKQALGRSDSSSVPPVTSSAKTQDIIMSSNIPAETVNDFLKTIETPHDNEQGSEIIPPPDARLHTGVDSMDIDEIPGLRSSRLSREKSLDANQPLVKVESAGDELVTSRLDEPPYTPSLQSQLPSSSDSATTAFSRINLESELRKEIRPRVRRGKMRPVASDFVDFDSGPSGNESAGNGFSIGAFSRRSIGGANFSSVNMRRCVIDLSDSEGDDDLYAVVDTGNLRKQNTVISTFHISKPSVPRQKPTSTPTSNSRAMSPAALQKKEMEIQRMREMIALMEKNQQQKLLRTTSTIDIEPPVNQTMVKQEPDVMKTSMNSSSELVDSPSEMTNDTQTNLLNPAIAQDSMTIDQPEISQRASTGTITAVSGVAGQNIDNVTHDAANVNQLHPNGVQVMRAEAMQPVPDVEKTKSQAREPANEQEMVDVDLESSSSAQPSLRTISDLPKPEENQDPQQFLYPDHTQTNNVNDYHSLFDSYPLLGSGSCPRLWGNLSVPLDYASTSSSHTPHSTEFYSTQDSLFPSLTHTSSIIPDLKPLKLATASKLLDPSKRICQYEVPGGGVCRDEGCEDLHLSRLNGKRGAEPSDQETAEYVNNAIPKKWQTEHQISSFKIFSAMQAIGNNMTLNLEERVAKALTMLGQPPPPS